MAENETNLLYQLARLYGVETSYYDGMGQLQQATVESLLIVLKALGAPLNGLSDVNNALREHRQKQWQQLCEPVVVVWEGEPAYVEINSPANQSDGLVECSLKLENGDLKCWTCKLEYLPVTQVTVVEGTGYIVMRLELPTGLPYGYHRLQLNLSSTVWEALVIVAPCRAYSVDRIWGAFLPLYALQSNHSLGTGDLTDLGTLFHQVRGLGGSIVGTLPLLATYIDEPFEPSPYAPVSRLFWNEFYLDVTRIPEFNRCSEAKRIFQSEEFQREIADLNMSPLVDYRRGMSVKRKVLECLARCCFSSDSDRLKALWKWVDDYPMVRDYARFRAVQEAQRAGWPAWPERMQEGIIRDGDYDPEVEQYHIYVQWAAQEQFSFLSNQIEKCGPGLYLDLPLGVNSAGYDVWREKRTFALEVSMGAPPDSFFTRGQDWGLSPMHPERMRERGYQYFISCLRHHMQHAGVLRLDHVAGLHRLFWIPKGLGPQKGVYVSYRAEEFYALLTLESHRYKTALVGEDLGTVPQYVRTALDRHNIYRMYILPFQKNSERGFNSVPENSLASLNTHDMPPFSSFWANQEYDDRLTLVQFLMQEGWLEYETVNVEVILKACLKFLAASPARIVLINLEDLWLEMAPQNVPGTQDEHLNWRRKARCALERFFQMPQCVEILKEVNRLRNLPPKLPSERLDWGGDIY